MLLLGIFLNAALLFLIQISAVPLDSGALNPAIAPNAYLFPSQLNVTNPTTNPNPSEYKVLCFETKAGLNLTAVAEDCATVLNDVILRLDGPFEKRAFFRQKYMNSNGHWVPSRWVFGQCTVYTRSALSASVDLFTLFEVALSANKILSDCVTSHRESQGGFTSIGSRESSYHVGLQGNMPGINVNAINDADIRALPKLEVSKRTLDTKRAILRPTEPQPRIVESSGALISLNEALAPSNSTGKPKAKTDDDLDCFPRGSRLPDVNADDCNFVINFIILGMKDPLRAQSWGFTDAVDNDLSLPEYRWIFNDCFIRVKNIDETQIDTFRPVDVAALAQRIVQRCVADTRTPLGGTADIGWLGAPLNFYIAVLGAVGTSGENSRNRTTLSLPSDGPRPLESRASLNLPEANPWPTILTEGLKAGERYPVHCFDPTSVHRSKPADASDCRFIINDIILRLPNPMIEQTFGYTDDVDINLSIKDSGQWIYGQCVVLVANIEKTTSRDRFRFLDVAYTAHRIMEQCVERTKYSLGGTANIGTIDDNFYVGVGGVDRVDLVNGTILGLASATVSLSPSSTIPLSPSRYGTEFIASYNYSGTEFVDLAKRSTNITELLQASIEFAPPVRCFRSGMPAAQKVDIQDCTDAAMVLLSDPKILIPQIFTTEPTGGIEMPFVQHNDSCYLMMDSSLNLSVSESIPLLKMVYWALEIMLTCVSGREQGFGGVSKMNNDRGIFVSVTGVNPKVVGDGLERLSDENTSATGLEDTSL